jgi:uncharacterized membrane protein YphA (DoxX/SURF4 family)
LQLALAAIFLLAGIAKFAYSQRFVETLYLSGAVPTRLVPIVRGLVPLGELIIGALLLFSVAQPLGAVLAGLMLFLFSGFAWTADQSSFAVSCACFGIGTSRLDGGVVARNVVLFAYAALAAALVRGSPISVLFRGHLTLLLVELIFFGLVPALTKTAVSAWYWSVQLADRGVVEQSKRLVGT